MNIYNIFLIWDQRLIMSTGRGDGEVLKVVTNLQILLFLNNRSIVNFCWWRVGGWVGVVCGCHNCMIPNIKTYFDKKVTFLVLVSVLQWNSHPHFLIYVCSKWKVINFKSLLKQILLWEKKLKACQEQPHLVSDCFIKVFYKTTTCPRQPLLSGPKSVHLIQV